VDVTPFWLGLPLGFWVSALVLLLGLAGSAAAAFRFRRRRAAEALRRLVLSQLLLAARRGLPLSRALAALGEELDRRGSPDPTRLVLLDPLLALPRRFERGGARWQARAVHDLAGDLERSEDLHCLSRVPGPAFPAPLPQLLVQAQRRGALLATLEELVALDDDALRLRGAVRGSLLYPVWLLVVCFACALFVEAVVWDKLLEIKASIAPGASPLLDAVTALRRSLLVGLPLAVGWLWLVAGALVTDRGGLARRLPGARWLQAGFTRARTLGLLRAQLRCGAPLAEALRVLALSRLAPDGAVERAVAAAQEGAGLRDALPAGGLARLADLERLPASGDQELPALDLLARAAAREATTRVDRAAAAALPLLLGLLGLLVACSYVGPHLIYHGLLKEASLW
jgi:type II secretory pathway component PulF